MGIGAKRLESRKVPAGGDRPRRMACPSGRRGAGLPDSPGMRAIAVPAVAGEA